MSRAAATTFVPNSTSLAIMKLIHGYLTKTHKPWNLIDQKWMLTHLAKWYGVEISRSALIYNLAILRKQGIIESICRHRRDPQTGEFICEKTLYKMTRKLKSFFNKLAAYFQRCDWVPSFAQLQAGMVPVVGAATTPEEVHKACLEERRRRKKLQKRRRKR